MSEETYRPVVLIVEDEAAQRLFYQVELEEAGYRVITAASGPEALDIVKNQHVDVVVVDIAMPGMDGLETLSRLIGIDRQIPVVINTAYSDFRDDYAAWTAEAYVIKESDSAKLIEAIGEVLQRRGIQPPQPPQQSQGE